MSTNRINPRYYKYTNINTPKKSSMVNSKLNKIMINVNWNNYINSWLLLKTIDDKWYFGQLVEYDANTKTLKLLALVNRRFYYIEIYSDSIVETWAVDKWTQYRFDTSNTKTYAYIANNKDNTISVIDTETRQVVAEPIANIKSPYALATTPNGRYLYITSYLYSDSPVTIIDLTTMEVVKTITVGGYPKNIAISPNGKYAYVSNWNDNTISAIDTASKTLAATIPVGPNPLGIAFTPDSRYAYVVNHWDNYLSIINTDTKKVLDETVSVTSGLGGIVITPDGKYALATKGVSNEVVVISLENNSIVKNIKVGRVPSWIALTPNGKYAYVTNSRSNSVSVIDVARQEVVGEEIPVGSAPERIAITPTGMYAYVTNSKGNTVCVITLALNRVVTTIPVGSNPMGVAFGKSKNDEPDKDNWNNWVDSWLLIKYSNGEWVFGKLVNYDTNKNQLTLLSLVGDKFRYTNESSNNIAQIWHVDRWRNVTTRSIESPSVFN